MSINFLYQAIRIFESGNFTDTELWMIYDHIRKLDNDVLFSYFGISVEDYTSALHLLEHVITKLIIIYQEDEVYEKCSILKNKLNIINKIIENEYIEDE